MDFDNVFLITTVPVANAEAVLQALGDAGAGEIGLYTHCAFTNPGTGRFQPDAASNPAVGDRGVAYKVGPGHWLWPYTGWFVRQ